MRSLKNGYILKKDWDEDTFVQGDHEGLVFSKDDIETVAFFEAFPINPKTFIRGEGVSLEEAEDNAWKTFQNIINCANHEFERLKNSNHATCKHCDLFQSDVLKSINNCSVCNKEEVYIEDYDTKKHLCIKDFIKINENSLKQPTNNFIDMINKKDFISFKINRVKYLKVTKLIEDKIIEIDDEYELSKIIKQSFATETHNYLISSIKAFPEFKFRILSLKYLSDYLIFFPELYKQIYIDSFYGYEKELLSHSFINRFATEHDNFFVNKYGDEFNRKIINT